jgi:hypothetical protein
VCADIILSRTSTYSIFHQKQILLLEVAVLNDIYQMSVKEKLVLNVGHPIRIKLLICVMSVAHRATIVEITVLPLILVIVVANYLIRITVADIGKKIYIVIIVKTWELKSV